MPSRGALLFDDLPDAAPPPPERLKPGQPGRNWREIGPGVWLNECADGRRCMVGFGGRVVWLNGGKGS